MEITRRSFLLGLSAGAFAGLGEIPLVFAGEAPKNLISVADFGALPDGSDAGPGARKAIAALPPKGGATLYFPPGQYHFKQSSGDAMVIEHIERLVVDGTGSTFLFEGTTSALRVRFCESPLIHGFTIDFNRPPFSQGEVLDVRADARACAIRIDPDFPVTGREQVQAVGTYNRKALFASKDVDAFYPVKAVSLMGPQILHLIFKWPQPYLTAGDTVVLRHAMYDGCGIALGHCRSPRLQNISIYATAGFGVIGSANENMTIDRLRIERRPNSDRLVSTCADGLHYMNGIGKVVLTNSFIEGTADDCVNVLSTYMMLIERIDARTALVRKSDKSPFNEHDLPLQHAVCSIIDARSLEKIGEAMLVASEPGKDATFHFNSDLPNFQAGDLLFDNSHRSALTVSQCIFPGSRGRGVLAHNDAVIERCKFVNQGNEAILLTADIRDSFEGPAVEGVKILQNEIDSSYRKGVPPGAIPVGAIRLSARVPEGSTAGIVNHDIQISGNRIRGSNTAGIVANYTKRLMIDNNRFENNHGPAIVLKDVRSASLINNICTPPSKVSIDPASKSSVELKQNFGLEG